MVNKVVLVGRIGRAPEVQFTPSGVAVAKFSVATSETWKDKQGNKQEKTEWHNIVAWNKLAEICGEYVTKGMLVYVEGKLTTRSWEDKQSGQKRYATEVTADTLKMLGGGEQRPPKSNEQGPPTGGSEDDIPF